ncbi:MAG: hypothetical protein WDN69_27915 [Aliidongia sp.]
MTSRTSAALFQLTGKRRRARARAEIDSGHMPVQTARRSAPAG